MLLSCLLHMIRLRSLGHQHSKRTLRRMTLLILRLTLMRASSKRMLFSSHVLTGHPRSWRLISILILLLMLLWLMSLCPPWNLHLMTRMFPWVPNRRVKSSPSLEFFVRRKSLPVIGDAADSDSAQLAQGLCHLLHLILLDLVPCRSCLRASSRAKSRAPSRSRGRTNERSRSRASPERRIEDGKARVTTVSGSGAGSSVAKPLPAPLPWMPEDASLPYFRGDFLRWTALSLQRDWEGSSRCWPNLRVGLYLYEPSADWPCSHPRSFAAGALSQDEALPEPWVCWACYNQQVPKRHGNLRTLCCGTGIAFTRNHFVADGLTMHRKST